MSVELFFGANKDEGYYNDNRLISCDAISSVTVIGDSISIDELHATAQGLPCGSAQFIDDDDLPIVTEEGLNFCSVYGTIRDMAQIKFGEPIWYYVNGSLSGKFYFSSATQLSKDTFEIVGVSAIGLLDAIIHDGGIYAGSTVNAIIADIIGNSIPYTVDNGIKNIEVSGWLPIASKKENLHQLLLAIGIDIKKDANGDIIFYFNDGNSEKTIPDDRLYYGGKVNFQTKIGRVDVTQHSFLSLAGDTEETLFDNTSDAEEVDELRVEFSSAPIHNLRVTGTLVIESSGVNYAVVSGKGVLYGKPYTHTTAVISATGDANSTSVKTVTNCTLISALNGGNVAQRLLAYYSSARFIQNDIIVLNEKSGERVTVKDPFGETQNAFIKSMDVVASRVVKASCEMVCGYTPVFQGNTYGSSIVLTGTGTYTVPQGKKYLTLILIGGGQGGQGGLKGSNGSTRPVTSEEYSVIEGYTQYKQDRGDGGAGGSAGQGGAGGRIFQKVISVNAGDVFQYSCGAGGNGGNGNGGTGSQGGNTTFGDLTSANGASAVEGFTDRFSSIVYGKKGTVGVAGGAGGAGGWSRYYTAGAGYAGSAVQGWNGGAGGAYKSNSWGSYTFEYYGNGGGGAAMGANGGRGADGDDLVYQGRGQGGAGASASIAGVVGAIYGQGGGGGNGGGGGGGNGAVLEISSYSGPEGQAGGQGGNGSPGGKGADGCIIIFV